MGLSANYAAVAGAQNMLRQEEYASGMGQSANYAAVTGAQIMLKMEDCAGDMTQRSNYAIVTGAQHLIANSRLDNVYVAFSKMALC